MNSKEDTKEEELEQSDTSEEADAGTAIEEIEDESINNTEEEDIIPDSEGNDQEADGDNEDTPDDQDVESDSEEVSDDNQTSDSNIEEAQPKRFNKSFRVTSLVKARNLLKGPVLYISYVLDDVHMTVILRSVSWFDHEYFDRIISFLRNEHPTLDVKILGDADFGDPTKPEAKVKLVETSLHDTVMKAISAINGWKFVPHITFTSDEIPSEIKNMKLEIKFSYPNWKYTFNGDVRASSSRMKGRLNY